MHSYNDVPVNQDEGKSGIINPFTTALEYFLRLEATQLFWLLPSEDREHVTKTK